MKTKHVMTKEEVDAWFVTFDHENPMYYKAFVKLAKEIRGQGHRRYGAQTIMERLRWESEVRDPSHKYKLSNPIKNRLCARFVRKLLKEDPSFSTFFKVTNLKNVYEQTDLVDEG